MKKLNKIKLFLVATLLCAATWGFGQVTDFAGFDAALTTLKTTSGGGNFALGAVITIAQDYTIESDAEHPITIAMTSYSINVNSGYTLTIGDNVTFTTSGGSISNSNGGTININGGSVTNTGGGSTVPINVTGGNCTISGGTFTSNSSRIVAVSGGKTLTITGGSFTSSGTTGRCVYGSANQTKIYISGGIFNATQTGAICVLTDHNGTGADATLAYISGGTFTGGGTAFRAQKFSKVIVQKADVTTTTIASTPTVDTNNNAKIYDFRNILFTTNPDAGVFFTESDNILLTKDESSADNLTPTVNFSLNADILYTIDGSDPSTSGTAISSGTSIPITIPTTLKVVAKKVDGAMTFYGAIYTFKYKKPLTWLGTSNEWNLAGNWNSNSIPESDDYIIIPTSTSYPVLQSAATCDNITFEAGAQLGNQHFLTATNGATVRYSIPTDRWNLLTTPIPATANDFYADKNPSTWLQTFAGEGAIDPQWNYITDLNRSFLAGDGFALFINGDGSNYNNFSVNGNLANTVTVNKSLSFATDENLFALVGNPFISTIDFDQLSDETQIGSAYYIYTGSGYSGYHTSNGSFGYASATADLTNYIAPLQSFIVEKGTGNGDLPFHASIQTPNEASVLKTVATTKPQLNIVAATPSASVKTIVAYSETAKHARKLFDAISATPDIYTLQGNEALGVQILSTDKALIPIGLRTNYKGKMNFTFTGMDNYDAQITFTDATTGAIINLTGLDSSVYEFDYTPLADNEENRFTVQLAPKTITGVALPTVDKVVETHYYNLQGVHVSNLETHDYASPPSATGIYIVKKIYESGKSDVQKLILKR
ncbi:MAG: chitobiase/beta-hexosaminidase C-terminal domain-containing protein [Candidatus Symbiothrix sp.]|jgi:hypothetical protein|nr:chitobiase/beta-hexosaminidase C-terminal domain-containing protein [Candidatus Symbiothrix sp.]